LDKQQPAQVQR